MTFMSPEKNQEFVPHSERTSNPCCQSLLSRRWQLEKWSFAKAILSQGKLHSTHGYKTTPQRHSSLRATVIPMEIYWGSTTAQPLSASVSPASTFPQMSLLKVFPMADLRHFSDSKPIFQRNKEQLQSYFPAPSQIPSISSHRCLPRPYTKFICESTFGALLPCF